MGMVLEGFFVVALLLAAMWLWSVRGSVRKDVTDTRAQEAKATLARERAAREARLYQDGEPLRCLGCEAQFLGPLSDTGCPQCHLSALVVTESDYERGRQAAAQQAQDT